MAYSIRLRMACSIRLRMLLLRNRLTSPSPSQLVLLLYVCPMSGHLPADRAVVWYSGMHKNVALKKTIFFVFLTIFFVLSIDFSGKLGPILRFLAAITFFFWHHCLFCTRNKIQIDHMIHWRHFCASVWYILRK
jgi:hypothetical protein